VNKTKVTQNETKPATSLEKTALQHETLSTPTEIWKHRAYLKEDDSCSYSIYYLPINNKTGAIKVFLYTFQVSQTTVWKSNRFGENCFTRPSSWNLHFFNPVIDISKSASCFYFILLGNYVFK